MAEYSSNPFLPPQPIRLARPLIEGFVRSPHCPVEHRWHAKGTLPVLALFVAMTGEHDSSGLDWEGLDPDLLVATSMEADPTELGFLRDLLDVSASFYAYLTGRGLVPFSRGAEIRAQLGRLAVGMRGAA